MMATKTGRARNEFLFKRKNVHARIGKTKREENQSVPRKDNRLLVREIGDEQKREERKEENDRRQNHLSLFREFLPVNFQQLP